MRRRRCPGCPEARRYAGLMALPRKFLNDDEANKMLSLPQRAPYGTELVLKKHA